MSDATRAQNRAAEPDHSTWLSANAGSGKTRVLTDRVARLLLNGVDPQSILCLTYTKAAASEMQNRLFQRLGDWAMKPNGALAQELQGLGVTGVGDPALLAEARRLFARAIETPGGLRIQTIHSFCAGLLRRFPLEAGVSPSFVEMDERNAAILRDAVLDEIAEGEDKSVLSNLLAFVAGDGLLSLADTLIRKRDRVPHSATREDIWAWYGLKSGTSFQGLIRGVFAELEPVFLARLARALDASEKSTDQKAAAQLLGVDWSNPDPKSLELLFGVFLYGSGAKAPHAAKTDRFPTKDGRAFVQDQLGELFALMERVEEAREPYMAVSAATATAALIEFARVFLPLYRQHKEARGWLGFDDLILKTRDLLSDESVALWVLYKLDGGLDHILVDEAQDTSPEQWQVIERLAQEMTSGQGAEDGARRTIFVVGDKKQSIYSFQGADPREFDRMRDFFRGRLAESKSGLRDLGLESSFRSSAAILQFVDEVLPITDQRHRAFHELLPGRVDLWPVVAKAEDQDPAHWYDPVDLPKDTHHTVELARKIARQLKALIGTETVPAENGNRRLIQAGDILILVRRRKDLFEEIIRACKALDLPIAGADRMKLGNELAVQDIVSLLKFLATPEDNLALAEALRSPLFGWTENDLFRLAAGREQTYIWQIIRGAPNKYPQTALMLRDLRDSADFMRPYDLIERILIRHHGRHRLLARLGKEAEDGIDALLNQALIYERTEAPSLTGFLAWLESDDVEIKRQMDNAGNQIRVMTVHGAKGLEAPIVVLPDTAKRVIQVRDEILELDDGAVGLKLPANTQPQQLKDAVAAAKAAQEAENQRLFYVAATRAQNWLIIAGCGDVGGPDDSWHQQSETALKALGAMPLVSPTGAGLRLDHGSWDDAGVLGATDLASDTIVVPDWLSKPAEAEARPDQPRSPSDLGGAKAIWADGDQEGDGTVHGTAVHLLLERLPVIEKKNWDGVARILLADLPEVELAAALAEAATVITHPEFDFLFDINGQAEVEISAALPELNGERITGAIDRLVVEPDRVLAVDFKSNAVIPKSAAETPEGLLRQLGAYHSALSQIYADRPVEVAILWTKSAELMRLPHDIVRNALSGAATS